MTAVDDAAVMAAVTAAPIPAVKSDSIVETDDVRRHGEDM